jgi:hypothetical protein
MKTQIGKTESPANQEPLGEEIPITLPMGTEARKSQSIPRRNVFTVLALVATFGVGWWREATFGMCIHRGFCNVHRSILGWCVVMLLGLAGEIRAGVVYHVDNGGSDAASGAETRVFIERSLLPTAAGLKMPRLSSPITPVSVPLFRLSMK